MLLLRVVPAKVAVFGGRAYGDDIGLAAARRYVEALAEAWLKVGVRVSALAVAGEPGTMIAAESRTQRAGMLAMTAHRKGAPGCSDLGCIVTGSLQSTRMPLLLVPTCASTDRDDRVLSSSSRPA